MAGIPEGQKLTKELIDKLYSQATGKAGSSATDNINSARLRGTLLGMLDRQNQNIPEKVGAGGDALNELYRMIPIRMRVTGWEGGMGSAARGYYDENEALRNQTRNSIFNLEQQAKAEKLKGRKKDKVAFGGKPSTPERKLPLASTLAAEGTLLGGGSALGSAANNKTLLGG